MAEQISKRTLYELVFVHLARSLEVLEQARMVGLTASDLDGIRIYDDLRIVYAAVEKYYGEMKSLPTIHILRQLVEEIIEHDATMSDRLRYRIYCFLEKVFSFSEKDLFPDYILRIDGYLQRVVDDLKLHKLVLRTAEYENNPEELNELIQQTQNVYTQTRVSRDTTINIFNPKVIKEVTVDKPRETGIKFIDMSIGGLRKSSFAALIAESSGGKTMLGVQAAVEQALRKRKVLGLYYEQPIFGDISERYYSYAAEIPRSATQSNFENYSDEIKECIHKTSSTLNNYVKLLDMSGTEPGQGTGGVKEIEIHINRLRSSGYNPEFILVDWVGNLVDKCSHLPEYKNKGKTERIHEALTRLNALCRKLDCTIVALHQIAPAVMESKTPLFKPDQTMAAECKGMPFLMDYMFTFGKKCDVTSCMWFGVVKARGAPKSWRIVRMDAENNKIEDANDFWSEIRQTASGAYFVPKKEKGQIGVKVENSW